MKILTKEEEQAHYNATVKGGITGGVLGLALVRSLPLSLSFPPNKASHQNQNTMLTPLLPRVEQPSTARISASTPSAN